ncbi:hypothetical protein NQ317_000900 [Molorchus minor]|uniref:Flotillin C-terminal domain-containing protein n=1 Tax=Molorchus minor TaxID=1323400 RepID=A0ABQ9JJX7_9CUCU|nr:hypothetical protein NQ317_000900 [Molorchus minor]
MDKEEKIENHTRHQSKCWKCLPFFSGYLKSLGMARTAEVKRDARIGEAEARAEAQIKEAMAEEQRMASVFLNDTEIAKARRDFELKKSAYDVEVQTKNAEAELAYELQAAKTKQKIKEEQMQIKVVERTQQIAVQEQEIARKERELEATVRRPAEAEKFRLEKIAEANHRRVVLEAEAEAEAIRLRGEAEAFAIEAKAKADAEQMAKKAEAFKEYKAAAMVDMYLDALPKVAAEVAAPLSQAKKITMVSSGTGEIGASKLTGEVLDIVTRVPELVKAMTGVDISKRHLVTKSSIGELMSRSMLHREQNGKDIVLSFTVSSLSCGIPDIAQCTATPGFTHYIKRMAYLEITYLTYLDRLVPKKEYRNRIWVFHIESMMRYLVSQQGGALQLLEIRSTNFLLTVEVKYGGKPGSGYSAGPNALAFERMNWDCPGQYAYPLAHRHAPIGLPHTYSSIIIMIRGGRGNERGKKN